MHGDPIGWRSIRVPVFFTEGIVLQTIRVHLQAVNGVVSVWSFATCEDILILAAKNTATGKSVESFRVVTLLHL